MIITLFAVGSNVEVAKYSSWLVKKFNPVTQIPRQKSSEEITTEDLLQSLVSGATKFFRDNDSAQQFANQQTTKHEADENRSLSSPAVFKLIAEINTSTNKFRILKVKSIKILQFEERVVNKEISDIELNNSSFLSISKQQHKKLSCSQQNFEGDIAPINRYQEAFTFLCSLTFFEKNNPKSPVIPSHIKKRICEYIAEEEIKAAESWMGPELPH